MRRGSMLIGVLLVVGTAVGAGIVVRSSAPAPGLEQSSPASTASTGASAPEVSASLDDARDSVAPGPSGDSKIRVIEVIDGDTVDIEIDGRWERVRLLGVNAPEDGECLANAARSRLSELLEGDVEIRFGSSRPDRDAYGRLLTDLLVDDESVGRTLTAEGLTLSVSYGRSEAEQRPLDELQTVAQANGLGLWGRTVCGGSGTSGVRIAHIEFDAPGNDGENLNGEWIEIAASEDTDLTGWSIRDESSSHRYSFPSSFSLEAGTSVVVRSGCGADAVGELFWCAEGSAIWNNTGDTGFLVTPSGSFADVWSY